MLYVFKNKIWFTLLFFSILIIDILVKLNLDSFLYRYFSKPPVVLLLIAYYYINNKEKVEKHKKWMYLSLSVFLIGDLVVINHDRLVFLVISILCYAIAKIFLSFRFVPKHDFNISRLFPLSILVFIYTMGMVSIVYENLGNLLIPSIVCFFLTLLLFQFAVLRRYAFNRFSYLSVLIGVILFILSESMMAIKIFKTELPLHNILTILFYGSSLYFIVIGIVNEKEVVSEDETDINFY